MRAEVAQAARSVLLLLQLLIGSIIYIYILGPSCLGALSLYPGDCGDWRSLGHPDRMGVGTWRGWRKLCSRSLKASHISRKVASADLIPFVHPLPLKLLCDGFALSWDALQWLGSIQHVLMFSWAEREGPFRQASAHALI